MKKQTCLLVVVFTLTCISPSQVLSQAKSACSCIIPLDSTFSIVPFTGDDGCNGCPGMPPQYRNDDSFTDPPIDLPFDFCFYGQTYNQVYINNNGNVSFGMQSSDHRSEEHT